MNKLEKMLALEGVTDTFLDDDITYLLKDGNEIIGFFTVGILRSFPVLRHFIIDKKHRSPSNARKLGRAFCALCKVKGFTHVFVNAKKDYLKKVIEYYFKKKPYTDVDGTSWYFVEVR
jgi:hypothetical protein